MSFEAYDNYECEGQLNFEDYGWGNVELYESLFAVSKIFARARKEMNLPELKAFAYVLSNLKFKEDNGHKILLDKKTMAKVVGINSDIDHLSEDLRRSIGQLPKHSYIEFNSKDVGFYECGFVITRLTMYKNNVRILFNPDYMPLFSKLEKDYITMWSGDIFSMRSERSIEFYEKLRLETDSRMSTNHAEVGIKWFKDMFNIPKDGKGSYMRKNGHFDRPAFEKYVIDPLCEDLAKCKMITLVLQPNGKYYEKIKRGGRVIAYRFDWMYSSHPRVATASEVKRIQEKVDKNPQVLKVAKDLLDGEKKVKKDTKKNRFNNFNQRTYNADELEKLLLTSDLIN